MKQKLLKTMLLLSALAVGSSSVWATPTTYSFSSIPTTGWSTSGGSQTINGISWTYSSVTYIGVSSSKIQVGSKNNPQTSNWTIQTAVSNFGSGKKITDISITAYTTATSATYDISAGGSSVKSGSLTTSSATYSVSSLNVTSGDIVITLRGSSTSKAMYLSDISVTYDDASGGGGGGSDPSISLGSTSVNATEAAVSTTSIDVTYNNLTNYDADVIFYEANGTTYATYDHDWITAEINASTKNLDYSISANTGAARTAYLRVYAVGDEGEAESDLITISQAAKTVAAPEYNLASSGNYLAGTDLTITSAGNTIYYNLTTNGDTPADPTSSSTEYTGPIALSSGTVKVKAIAYDAYGNASTVASRTVYGIAPANLPFNWAGGTKTAFTALTGIVGYSLGDYTNNDSNRPYLIQFNGTGDYIEIFMNERPLKVFVDVKMIGGSSTSTIKFQESTDGVDFTDVEELSISGSQNDVVNLATSKAFASTTRVIKLLFTKGSNVGVGPIKIAGGSLPVTLNSSGYATFASAFALDFSDDSEFSAWQITAANSSTGVITFSQIDDAVEAGTGVLLKGTASATINIPVVASGSFDVSDNLLEGITTATAVTASTYYGLKGDEFRPVSAGTVPAGRALLPASEVSSVKAFVFAFEDDADGINLTPALSEGEGAIYNLAGQRLNKMQKGINIVNGKKIMVK